MPYGSITIPLPTEEERMGMRVPPKSPPPPPPGMKGRRIESTSAGSARPHLIEGGYEYKEPTNKRCKYCASLSAIDTIKCSNCGASF